MTSVWITHGDSDDYYGIHYIHDVHATRESAVAANDEAYRRNEAARTKPSGEISSELVWEGDKLVRVELHEYMVHQGHPASRQVLCEISEHTIGGAAS